MKGYLFNNFAECLLSDILYLKLIVYSLLAQTSELKAVIFLE